MKSLRETEPSEHAAPRNRIGGRDDIVWEPSPDVVKASNLHRLMRTEGLSDFAALWRKAVDDKNWFWDAVVRDLNLSWFRPYRQAFNPDSSRQWPEWFVDGLLNVADNCLGRHVREGNGNRVALIAEREDGDTKQTTYAELDSLSSRLANGLRKLGVERGDRVGLLLPMTGEAAAAILACAKLGAIFCPAFSGYAAAAVVTRFSDCNVKVVITADTYQRRGRDIDLLKVARSAASQLPGRPRVVIVSRSRERIELREGEVDFMTLIQQESESFDEAAMGPDEPLMILYTSGTSGRPKGTVHTHPGFLVKSAQDMAHAFDVRSGDVVFWVTDLGWIMGTWLIVAGLCLGATIVTYDGAPDYPGPDRIWRLIDKHRVSVFGATPSLVRLMKSHDEAASERFGLDSLRILGSTGEPWDHESWEWFFASVGRRRCPIINYSGGTEVGGGILACFPVFPQKPCAFNGPFPGMDADVFDGSGSPVRDDVGELVVKGPWPGQTRGLWRDAERYWDTYWSRWDQVWVHGDWAIAHSDGFWDILGRSDDTLKVAGKRVGPAEIEAAIESFAGVREAAVVALPDVTKGEVPIAFVTLNATAKNHAGLEAEIIEHVAKHLGRPLRPAAVRFVTELPRTRNGKLARRAIRDALSRSTGHFDLDALENPWALEAIIEHDSGGSVRQ